jgi:hypothetical protein
MQDGKSQSWIRGRLGGTCALRGCDPKKVLVGAAEAIDWIHRMKGKGIQAENLQIDWPELMRFKRSFTEPVPERREDGAFPFYIRAPAVRVNPGNEVLLALRPLHDRQAEIICGCLDDIFKNRFFDSLDDFLFSETRVSRRINRESHIFQGCFLSRSHSGPSTEEFDIDSVARLRYNVNVSCLSS